MKALSIALLLFATHARADSCFKYEGQTLEDAAEYAIMDGWVDHSTGNLACLKELVAKGANLKMRKNWGGDQSAVNLAAHAGRAEIFAYVLEQVGGDIGDMTDRQTALNLGEVAAIGGSVEIVKMLQAHGMPVQFKNGPWSSPYMKPSNYFLDSCSPILHEAVEWLRADLVKYLLGQGMNVNARCDRSFLFMSDGLPTPLLSLAGSIEAADELNGDVQGRHAKANETLNILIDAGGDLRAREDVYGHNAADLVLASRWISPEMKDYVRAHRNR